MHHLDIAIYGMVQGVGFRYFIVDHAQNLGISGRVMNVGNHVEIQAEGKEDDLKRLVEICRAGPARAHVERVRVTEAPEEGFDQFLISS